MSIHLPLNGAVDAPDVDAMLRQGEPLVLLDVRTPAEFAAAHIPGSYNVPLDQLTEHRAELASVDTSSVGRFGRSLLAAFVRPLALLELCFLPSSGTARESTPRLMSWKRSSWLTQIMTSFQLPFR